MNKPESVKIEPDALNLNTPYEKRGESDDPDAAVPSPASVDALAFADASAESLATSEALERELAALWDDAKSGDRYADKTNCHKILPSGRLWLGGCSVESLPLGTTHVVTLWDDARTDVPQWDGVLEQTVIRISDSFDAPLEKHLNAAVDFIDRALDAPPFTTPTSSPAIVYVHCQMGRSRSASVVIAYLMKAFNVSLRVAYLFLMRRRHCSALNLGFFAKLGDWEVRHWGRVEPTMTLLDYWRITVLHLEGRSLTNCRNATNLDIARHWSVSAGVDWSVVGISKRVRGLHFVCTELARISPQARETMRYMQQLEMGIAEQDRRSNGTKRTRP